MLKTRQLKMLTAIQQRLAFEPPFAYVIFALYNMCSPLLFPLRPQSLAMDAQTVVEEMEFS